MQQKGQNNLTALCNSNSTCSSPPQKKKPFDHDLASYPLLDLSPLVPKYYNQTCPPFPRLSGINDLTLIQTPALQNLRKSYLEQVDQNVNRHISGVLSWEVQQNQNSAEVSELEDGDEDALYGSYGMRESESLNNIEGEKEVEIEQKSTQNLLKPPQEEQKPVRKTCNCKKTQCLKLYCDCFRQNQTCVGCNCIGCHNTPAYQEERVAAMQQLTVRNPDAFKPKIQTTSHVHSKGCNCKKSGCQKKYCECYQAGLKCGDNCKCQQCKNCEQVHRQPKNYRNFQKSVINDAKNRKVVQVTMPVSGNLKFRKEL